MDNTGFKGFISNLSYAFLAQGISLLLSIYISLILPKILGINDFSYWQLFIFYFNYLGYMDFGLIDGIYLKYGGMKYHELDKTAVASQFWFLLILQMLIFIGIIFFSRYFLVSHREFVLIMAGLFMLLWNMNRFLGYIFQATNNTKTYSIASIINSTVFILLIIFLKLFISYNSYKIYIIVYLISIIVSLFYSIYKGKEIILNRTYSIMNSINASFTNIKMGISLTLSNIFGMLLFGFGRFIVDKIWGIIAFGKFSFAISLTTFFLLFINQGSMVLFPVLRRLERAQLKYYYLILRDLLILFLPIILLLSTPMQYFLELWLPNYTESIDYLIILLPICIFEGKMILLNSTYLKVLSKQKKLLVINLMTMMLAIILSFISGYVFISINGIIVSIIIAVAIRNLLSEIYVENLLKIPKDYTMALEIILIFFYIVCNGYKSIYTQFFVFFTGYIIFIIINFKKVIMVNGGIKYLINKKYVD